MLHLARKAFFPSPPPFPVLHIDTGRNFPEVLDFRDRTVQGLGLRLVIGHVQDDIDAGRISEEVGLERPATSSRRRHCCVRSARASSTLCSEGLVATRKARAKERIYSFRDQYGQWDPKNQRPELWNPFNGRHHKGEHIRVFPLSNWTELDVWQYIADERIEVPSIYFSHLRTVFVRDGMLMSVNEHLEPDEGAELFEARVRFRTVGDADCTGCVESPARTVEDIIEEVAVTRLTERGATRADDRISDSGMEDRKREGYF